MRKAIIHGYIHTALNDLFLHKFYSRCIGCMDDTVDTSRYGLQETHDPNFSE